MFSYSLQRYVQIRSNDLSAMAQLNYLHLMMFNNVALPVMLKSNTLGAIMCYNKSKTHSHVEYNLFYRV